MALLLLEPNAEDLTEDKTLVLLKSMARRFEQLENADVPMDVTLVPIVTEVRELQSSNARDSMVVTPLPIITVLREVQYQNARSPIEFTLSGIERLDRDEHCENA
jgi:hypothetical protein